MEIELDPSETAIAESGAFMMMDDGIQMETIFGDGSTQQKGILGKLMGAGKRLLTGCALQALQQLTGVNFICMWPSSFP